MAGLLRQMMRRTRTTPALFLGGHRVECPRAPRPRILGCMGAATAARRLSRTELGCGNGANILPLAYYGPTATFVGIDGALDGERGRPSSAARIPTDHLGAITPTSWRPPTGWRIGIDSTSSSRTASFRAVPDETRDALFALCADRLRPGGPLISKAYNTRPGWDVRGIIRDFLLTQTARAGDSASRAELLARALAASAAAALEAAADHPYVRLLANELRFVAQGHLSYIAHEFLAPHNHVYWRWDLLALARRYRSGARRRTRTSTTPGTSAGDRPRLIRRSAPPRSTARGRRRSAVLPAAPLADLHACPLDPSRHRRGGSVRPRGRVVPRAPSGGGAGKPDISTSDRIRGRGQGGCDSAALETLRPLWPRGLPVAALFPDGGTIHADLRLLHLHGLIELRLPDAGCNAPARGPLNERERAWGGYITTPYHTRESAGES